MYRHFITGSLTQAILIMLVVILACSTVLAEEKVYKFGVVPQFEVRKTQKIWLPILEEIEKQTGFHIELVGSVNISIFEDQLLAGEFDFAYMNAYQFLLSNESLGFTPLVRDVAKKLYGIIVARKDGKINSIEDLDGKTIAFPSPNALGATLLARSELADKFQLKYKPKYVRSHTSVYLNVVTGQVDAGSGVQKTLQKQRDNIKESLKVIYKTQKVATHPIAAHSRMPKLDQEKITKVLLALGDSKEGMKLIGNIPMKKIGAAKLSDYDSLKAMGLEKYYVK